MPRLGWPRLGWPPELALEVRVGGLRHCLFTLLDLCVSSLRRGHANLLCIVPILTDDPRRESEWVDCDIVFVLSTTTTTTNNNNNNDDDNNNH